MLLGARGKGKHLIGPASTQAAGRRQDPPPSPCCHRGRRLPPKSVGSPAEGPQSIACNLGRSPFPEVTLRGRRAARTSAVTARLPAQLRGHPGESGDPQEGRQGSAGSSPVPTQGSGRVAVQKAQLNTEGLKFGRKTVTGSGGARSRFYSKKKKKKKNEKNHPFCWQV